MKKRRLQSTNLDTSSTCGEPISLLSIFVTITIADMPDLPDVPEDLPQLQKNGRAVEGGRAKKGAVMEEVREIHFHLGGSMANRTYQATMLPTNYCVVKPRA